MNHHKRWEGSRQFVYYYDGCSTCEWESEQFTQESKLAQYSDEMEKKVMEQLNKELEIEKSIKIIEEQLRRIEILSEYDYEKELCFGYDEDGDFGLRIGKTNLMFYKWASPVICKGEFTDINDSNSKPIWRKARVER